MRARRDAAIKLLKTMMVASVVLPVALFSYAAWVSYQSARAHTDEQLAANLDIISEQANKIFQSIDLSFASVRAIVGDLSDDEIRTQEQTLHLKLQQLDQVLGAIDAIAVVDKNGDALVSSSIYPVPGGLNVADRDYFKAQVERDAGTYVGEVVKPRVRPNTLFGVSRRRAQNGEFAGAFIVFVVPKIFSDFYEKLTLNQPGTSLALARGDGAILARYPSPPSDMTRFSPTSGFRTAVIADPRGGIVTSNNSIEGVQRRVGYRPLGYGDLYVSDGRSTSQTTTEWLSAMSAHLIFGLPATILLVVLVLLAMRRTQEFYAEAERRELAEQSLRQAQKMEAVGQLTGGVAHDFNNLLTIIIGNLGIAKRGVVEARAERALDNALTGAQRAAQLTQRLLAFSRRQPLNPRAVDANKLIHSMSELLTRSLGETVQLETIGGAGVWNIEVDVSEMETTLLNLALNARDAMPEGGKLTIETSNAYLDDQYSRAHEGLAPGQYVLVAVTDNGTGMSRETIEKAFEPFYTTKETGKGTGLGLSQVYGFMKQSGGHVKIYSEVGVGTTINLYLPRHHSAEEIQPVDEPAGSHRGNGETILVVEDDDGVRQYASEILRDLNYQILEARDAASALRLLDADKPFDLLLTDVVLPGKNGRELATEIEKRRPGVKIIFMTGYSRNAIVHHGRLDRGTELITKPLIEGVLARKIRQVLDGPAPRPHE
jgi:signal transduction histidine kinase/CheY-like chemotaxis protein